MALSANAQRHCGEKYVNQESLVYNVNGTHEIKQESNL